MLAYLKQKTTITGMAALMTTGAAYLQGQMTAQQAITAIIFGIVMIVMPEEKTISQADIASLVGLAANAFALTKQAETPAAKPTTGA
ncbi:MAG: hypothetical protein P4L10_11200 [Acidobacteriaceae bacterium]|nr:hypothetical protein [Acidobacteriaceae bacterium]